MSALFPPPSSLSPHILSLLQTLSTSWPTLPPSSRTSRLQSFLQALPPPPLPPPLSPLVLQTISTFFPPPSSPSPPPDPLLSALLSLLTLCTSTPHPPPPSRPFQLSCAHLIHTLSQISLSHPSVSLRQHSLQALNSLILYIPPSLLAAFLPGLISALTRLLFTASTLHSSLLKATLQVLQSSFAAFPPVSTIPGTSFASKPSFSVSAALTRLRDSSRPSSHTQAQLSLSSIASPSASPSPFSAEKPPRSLLVTRDEKWAHSAAGELSTRLCLVFEAMHTPVAHPNVKARLSVAAFCSLVVKKEETLRLGERAKLVVRIAMAELRGDQFLEVREEVGKGGNNPADVKCMVQGLRSVVSILAGEDGEGVVGQVLKAMIKGRGEGVWVKVCYGWLGKLIEGAEGSIRGIVGRVGVEGICALLVDMLGVVWENGMEGEEEVGMEWNRVLEVAREMGISGMLAVVYGGLFVRGGVEDIEEEEAIGRKLLVSFKRRAKAMIILQSVVMGAMARADVHVEESEAHLKYLKQCVKEVLEAMTWFLVPAIEERVDEGVDLVDDTMISLKRCMLFCTGRLVKEFARLHEKILLRPMGPDVVLVVLLTLLKDVAHGDIATRNIALATLKTVATAARCSSERRLLARHLNFLISRLSRHLEESWAGDVLRFIIGSDGDEVSREATILLEGTLEDICNGLAGAADNRALRSLKAIQSVLSSAINLTHPLESDIASLSLGGMDICINEVVMSDADMAGLHKRLFYYCTDDIDNYNQLTGTKEREKEVRGHEEDGSEQGKSRNTFEAVALSTLDGMRDLLVGRPWNVRAEALSCASLAVHLLEKNEKELLPHAAILLPLLPEQFMVLNQERSARDRLLDNIKQRKLRGREDAEAVEDLVKHLNRKAAELPVVANACLLLAALAKCAGWFIRHRFVTLIYPKMRPLLRLASYFPSLLGTAQISRSGLLTAPPSYGAMAASDACLQAIASMAAVVPEALGPHALSLVKYLAVYFNAAQDPGAKGQRNIGHLNRSMLRYERERWQKRAMWAKSIVGNLRRVNAGDVLVGLLFIDNSAPAQIEARHPSLHAITIHKPATVSR